MRLQIFLAMYVICLSLPALLKADAIDSDFVPGEEPGEKIVVTYDLNELAVDKLDGTIMVQHPGNAKPFALGTLNTVEKGDIITVYDQSWVIFKDHKGDRIGFEGNTTVSIDEFYIGGPARQVRFLLQKGTILLKTNGCDSKQNFFEINCGSVVTAVDDSQVIVTYDPIDNEHLLVQYLHGKLSVIDKNNEYKFGVMPKVGSNVRNIKEKDTTTDTNDTQFDYIPEWSELNWENGFLIDKVPNTTDEMVKINFNRFFNDEDLLESIGNNILLGDNSVLMREFRHHVGGSNLTQAAELYDNGLKSYRAGRFQEAKDMWETAISIQPDYSKAKIGLKRLATEHPELKISETDWNYEKQDPNINSKTK